MFYSLWAEGEFPYFFHNSGGPANFHKQKIDSGAIIHVADSGIHSPKICKAKKFACKSLKGKGVLSGIRVIYAYQEEENKVEFIEIYYKGNKKNEDGERILKYFGEWEKRMKKIKAKKVRWINPILFMTLSFRNLT
jgi:hypothetical protein